MAPPATPFASYSLRRRLLLLLLGVVSLVWLGMAVLSFRAAHHEADELFDAQLVQVAETLAAVAAEGDTSRIVHELEEHAHRYDLPFIYQVFRMGRGGPGALVLRSPRVPETPLVMTGGFREGAVEGAHFRFFAVEDEGLWVVAGQRHLDRYRVAAELSGKLLLPMVLALPFLGMAIWWVVGGALGPLGRIAREVARMDTDRLLPLAAPDPCPAEVAPLVGALDALIGRLARALDNERRFTADAAHELRTPLAAVKIQAQVARRTGDEQARGRALDQVLAGVERMSHLVDQLLTLARLDPAGKEAFGLVDLAQVAEGVCAELAPAAIPRNQSLSLDAAPCRIHCNPLWLAVLLRNLVDNALRHAGPGARIEVAVAGGNGAPVRLSVRDDGPGIPAGQRPALLGRFARGGALDVEGCGLGLSIAQRVAEVHGGQLVLGDGLPRADGGAGLEVAVALPGI